MLRPPLPDSCQKYGLSARDQFPSKESLQESKKIISAADAALPQWRLSIRAAVICITQLLAAAVSDWMLGPDRHKRADNASVHLRNEISPVLKIAGQDSHK